MCGAHSPSSRTSSRRRTTSASASSSSRSRMCSFGITRSAMNARTCASLAAGGAKVEAIAVASHGMRLGFYMGYAQPGTNPLELLELARLAGTLGYGSAGAAGAWGADAGTPPAGLGAQTATVKLGTGIMQIQGRSPANTAMTAATLDLLSGGRVLLGLGTSGPQVVEGWHGQEWGQPLEKTREYVSIVRAALRRERLEHHGRHYDIPVQG